MAKDPARVAAGKKAWAALSPAKKAAIKARLARVRPNKGGGGGTTKGNPKTKAVATTGTTAVAKPRKLPMIGASYTAGKAAAMLLSPVVDTAIAGQAAGTPKEVVLKEMGEKILSIPYAYNLGVMAIDAAVDVKTAQATALTKGSASAWLPEIYLASLAFDEVTSRKGQAASTIARTLNQRIVRAHQGYDPKDNAIVVTDPEFRTYRTLKHAGQLFRRVRGRSHLAKRLTAPLAKVGKMLGIRP